MASTDFRFHRLLPLIFMVFLTISVWSFHPEDMDFFAGGLQGSAYPHNFFGAWGTKISWFLLVTLGLGTYHMLFLTLLCLLRRFLWRKGLLASNWEYFLSLILNVVSVSLMLGTMPEAMPGCTAALNISHFPGGILGQFLGSPEQGCISQAINTTGCFIFAFTLFCLTLGFLFRYDWMVPAKAAAKALQEYWRRKQAERAAKEQAAKERAEQPPPPAAGPGGCPLFRHFGAPSRHHLPRPPWTGVHPGGPAGAGSHPGARPRPGAPPLPGGTPPG